jgi:hypothetical protein
VEGRFGVLSGVREDRTKMRQHDAGRAEAGRSIYKEGYIGWERGREKINGVVREWVVQTRISQHGLGTASGNIE